MLFIVTIYPQFTPCTLWIHVLLKLPLRKNSFSSCKECGQLTASHCSFLQVCFWAALLKVAPAKTGQDFLQSLSHFYLPWNPSNEQLLLWSSQWAGRSFAGSARWSDSSFCQSYFFPFPHQCYSLINLLHPLSTSAPASDPTDGQVHISQVYSLMHFYKVNTLM